MYLTLYRALRAGNAAIVAFRLFMDELAFAGRRSELTEALLSWLPACDVATPCDW
jgi:hypothetical protein